MSRCCDKLASITVTVEAILNVVWLLLAFAGWVAVFRIGRSKRTRRGRQVRLMQLTAVLLAVLSLFPSVSVTDDVVRFQYLQALDQQDSVSGATQGRPLSEDGKLAVLRLADAWEQIAIVPIFCFAFLLIAVLLGSFLPISLRSAVVAFAPGRAPPCVA